MKMRYIVLFLSILVIVTSCKKSNFLDPKDTDTDSEETVFADSVKTMAYLTALYADVDYDIQPKLAANKGGLYSESTDESENRYPASDVVTLQLNSGSYSSQFYNHFSTDWSFLFSKVRQANIFIKDVDISPLSAAMKARTKAEARFLKAFYYHYLLKEFGGVPIIKDKVFTLEDDLNVPRNTYAECVDFLVSELDNAAQSLPLSFIGSIDYGRATKGACLALKSRILLHAASPLFNGGSIAKGNAALEPLTAYPTYDASRWQKAMDAAKAVMDLNQYELYTDNVTKPGYGFYKLFLLRVNKEFIFNAMDATGTEYERRFLPPSRGGTFFLHYPLQDLVDKFPMDNGKPISQDPRYVDMTDAMYQNRDPRFYYTITYNEKQWYNQTLKAFGPVLTYRATINANGTETANPTKDGLTSISTNLSTTTGYYRAKFLDENNAIANRTGLKVYPLIRYAEILLNYAEAANEVGQTQEAMNAIKQLRIRAGITPGADTQYGLPVNPSQILARDLIRNERDIELAFEEHRFFDIRRWKQGAKFNNWTGTGVEILRRIVPGSNPARFFYTYSRIPVRKRVFEDRVYIFPIGISELTLNKTLLQNPGW